MQRCGLPRVKNKGDRSSTRKCRSLSGGHRAGSLPLDVTVISASLPAIGAAVYAIRMQGEWRVSIYRSPGPFSGRHFGVPAARLQRRPEWMTEVGKWQMARECLQLGRRVDALLSRTSACIGFERIQPGECVTTRRPAIVATCQSRKATAAPSMSMGPHMIGAFNANRASQMTRVGRE